MCVSQEHVCVCVHMTYMQRPEQNVSSLPLIALDQVTIFAQSEGSRDLPVSTSLCCGYSTPFHDQCIAWVLVI